MQQFHPVQRLVKINHRRRYIGNLRVHKGIGQRINMAVAVLPTPFLRRFRVEQHLPHGGQAVGVQEHMLGAAQPDAPGAHGQRLTGVGGRVGVGHHPQLAGLVGPPEQHVGLRQVLQPRVHRSQLAGVHLPQRAVHADPVSLPDGMAVAAHLLQFQVNLHPLAAHDAGFAQAAGDHRGVAGDPAPAGDHSGGGDDAVNVVGLGFRAHQYDLFPPPGQVFGNVGVEAHPPRRGPRRRARAGRHQPFLHLGRRQVGGELRHQQLRDFLRVNPLEGLLPVNHPLAHHVHRRLHRRQRGALGVARLQQVEPPLLDGELHVLHVAVVLFQVVGQRQQFL